jgi:hypothetical protein
MSKTSSSSKTPHPDHPPAAPAAPAVAPDGTQRIADGTHVPASPVGSPPGPLPAKDAGADSTKH